MNPLFKDYLIQSSLIELIKQYTKKNLSDNIQNTFWDFAIFKEVCKKGSKTILFRLLMHVIMAKILSADMCTKSPTKYP